jgi:serine/threonine-protein phosphatase 2A regulatory subunit A
LRLNSVSNLGTIATALGAERTREELIPFLAESIEDEDEVLLALAQQLGEFVPYVGGQEHAATVLAPLESLCTVEEMSVRDAAVGSLSKVVSQMTDADVVRHVLPMLNGLSTRDWFTARVSAAALFPAIYCRVDSATQESLRDSFKKLCEDSTPMVRRAACQHLPALMAEVGAAHAESFGVPLARALAQDDQDSVRLLAVNIFVALAPLLDQSKHSELLLPFLSLISSDRSWRVRWSFADRVSDLSDALGAEATHGELTTAYVTALKDSEAEVRTVAAFKIAEFSERIPRSVVMAKIVPTLGPLTKDLSEHVRASLASVLMDLAPVLGSDDTVTHLLPAILAQLKDVTSQVRLNIISNLEKVNSVVGIEHLSVSLMPAIIELAKDNQWRVRLAIIEHMPLLARQLGIDFFTDNLANLCTSSFQDPVAAIRDAAAENLRQLVDVFGEEWLSASIMPQMRDMSQATSYLIRRSAVHALKVMSKVVSQPMLADGFMPLLETLATDPIPNIRFNVAKALGVVATRVDDATGTARVQPLLAKLATDGDKDVQYYANLAQEGKLTSGQSAAWL